MCFPFRGRYGDVSTGRFRDHCHQVMIENLRQVGGAMEREMSAQGEEMGLLLEKEGKHTGYK